MIYYVNHQIYGNFKPRPSRLSEEEIGKLYDNFVMASVDVMPVRISSGNIKFLLGLRSQEPKTWWTIGRSMKPGESPQETVSRALKEEFRLRLSKKELNKRLGFVCINSSTFSLREQPPRKNGRQNLIVVFSLDIKEEERKQFTVSQGSKYKKMKWFAVSETNIQGLNPIIGATISRLAEVCT